MSTVLVYRTHDVHKVAREFRRHQVKTLVPGDRSRKRSTFTGKFPRTAPGYVFPEKVCHAVFEKHAVDFLGVVPKRSLASLYVGRQVKEAEEIPVFEIGDAVALEDGPFAGLNAIVEAKQRKGYIVAVGQFRVPMKPQNMRRLTAPP